MKHASRIALLLAAVLLLSLPGCAPKPEPQPYEAPIRAYEALLNNADAAWPEAVEAAVGDFCSKELTQLATLMIQTGDTTDEIMTKNLLGEYREVYGSECTCKFAITKAEPMDKEQLEHYRAQLQSDSVFFDDNLTELQRDGAVDWESGLPLEETAEMEALCTTLRDRFAAAKVTEGYVVSVVITVSGGDLTEPEQGEDTMNILCIDGVWVIGDVFDVSYTN